ncbi:hypothetical protein MBLNU457_4685t1 [Dothideomycetes sp. NU457]
MPSLAGALAAGLSFVSIAASSPAYPLFEYPLPIPPNASPLTTVDVNGNNIDFYEMTIEPYERQVYPNLGNSSFVGYNGISPGPTYWIPRGRQTIVRLHNNMQNQASLHLHGSDTHAPWDGWADDVLLTNQFKDYYYPNDHAARAMWYHDHADHITANNAYNGLGGIWIIYDSEEDSLGLPNDNYDIVLAFQDRTYDDSGNLTFPVGEYLNQFGDVNEVNGQPWPFFNVEPRKYRLRLFDLSLSRPWDIYIADDQGNWIEFPVIASDCGLFGSPVYTKDIQMAPAERYEIVFDFAPYAGKNLTMGNYEGSGPNSAAAEGQAPVYGNTDKMMQFNVGNHVSDWSRNGDVPSTLNPAIQWPEATNEVAHTFNFQIGGDNHWTINGVDYDDVNNRVLARPQQGSTEMWEVVYAGGPGIHPVHVHLVSFQIVERTGGSRGLLPYESAGLKDVVNLEPGESAKIRAVYGPWNGLYMFHCHNLIHEDSMMMAVFNVSQLENQGYNVTTDYTDPMDPRFLPQYPTDNTWDLDQISSSVSYYGNLHCYDSTYTGSVQTSPPWSVGTATTYAAVTSTANNYGGRPTGSYGPAPGQDSNTAGPGQYYNQFASNHGNYGPPQETGAAPSSSTSSAAAAASSSSSSGGSWWSWGSNQNNHPSGPPSSSQGQSWGPPQGQGQQSHGPPSGFGGHGGHRKREEVVITKNVVKQHVRDFAGHA